MTRRLLSALTLLAAALILGACSLSGGKSRSAQTTASRPPQPIATPSPTAKALVTTTSATTPPANPALRATPKPTSTPAPKPSARIVTAAGCCGLFAWVDDSQLLVLDAPGGRAQTSIYDLTNGNRKQLGGDFGTSAAGLVALSDQASGTTRIVDQNGRTVSTIQNQGTETWIAPNGKRVAWLQPLPSKTPSSLLPRPVELWVADINGANAKPVLRLLASNVQWLADSRHLVTVGRTLAAQSPGVWDIDSDTGSHQVIVPATFVQALQVSPDGAHLAYLITFSGKPAQDGIWVSNADGTGRRHISGQGGFRWADGGSRLWLLQLAPDGGGNDHLQLIDTASDATVTTVALDGRVLDDRWSISPDGRYVAFWRETDQQTEVFGPLPGA
ncbi:MAG TPA: hypothetical protein VKU87_00405 [Thermomicrobiaceae bacterium]|nr:hypothetical protein [Thermomicrobiaceae bacterium]